MPRFKHESLALGQRDEVLCGQRLVDGFAQIGVGRGVATGEEKRDRPQPKSRQSAEQAVLRAEELQHQQLAVRRQDALRLRQGRRLVRKVPEAEGAGDEGLSA